LLVVLHLVAAAASAWALWGTWIAATVTVLCLIVPFTELPRWRALLSGPTITSMKRTNVYADPEGWPSSRRPPSAGV
jgi:hypothetical protein